MAFCAAGVLVVLALIDASCFVYRELSRGNYLQPCLEFRRKLNRWRTAPGREQPRREARKQEERWAHTI
jgi:GH24 family phage-related lysozyme (muramidase)